MKLKNVSSNMLEALVIGGSILGGGGGGSINEGMKIGRLAFEVGQPSFVSMNDLSPSDVIVTVSAVGAPAAKEQFVFPMDYVECVQSLESSIGRVDAMITNENGGLATINGLFQSAVTGIPIVDAACNGRAHPTGEMGAMQLNSLEDYVSHQAAAGGQLHTEFRITQNVKGSLNVCSHSIRQASIQAGGLVAVARNPVSMGHLQKHGAIHAISHAYEVGLAHQKGATAEMKIDNVAEALDGKVMFAGTVADLEFETVDGFDLGKFKVFDNTDWMELTIWNEYMTCEDPSGNRLATFPELIMTFDNETGKPVTSAEVSSGQNLSLVCASCDNLILGSGMLLDSNYEIVEKVLGKEILKYIKHIFQEGVNQ